MARHILSRGTALGAAAAIAAGAAGAQAAGALRGSPAAVRVAQRVLAHARQIEALRWRQRGDQWECPSQDGPIVGPAVKRPGSDCRRAIVTLDENLRNGVIVRSLATTTANGIPAHTELVTAAGDWTRTGHARCWDAAVADLRPIPAFSYTGEKLSIAAETPSVISLRGVTRGFREIDAIDAGTFAIREIDERVPSFGGTAQLVATFTEMARPFALPAHPGHICSDIVRFPPQRAR
ncbi:MAG TPA: hypothetical protein VHV28_01370 [Solirubrobacteraceae bacterium]|jgi:hypothetical protein|nr:hypothetical protein [Solirubrobacteraceae bacterium]